MGGTAIAALIASSRLRAAAALLALAAGPGAAEAQITWGLEAGVTARRLVERDDNGDRLVRERGPVPRLRLDAQMGFASGGALRADAAIAGGRLDYDGQTQAGTPLDSHTRHRDLELGAAWRPFAPQVWGEGWLVLRARQERRRIEGTAAAGGLRETSTFVQAGVAWQRDFTAGSWRLRPGVEWRTSVDHDLEVDAGGAFDRAELRGGRRQELVLGLDAAAAGSPWQWRLAWLHARQSASERAGITRGGVPIGTVRQPRIGVDEMTLAVRRAF